MKEVGFSDVYTYVLPRTARDDLTHAADGNAAKAPRSRSSSASSGSGAAPMDEADGMDDMAHLTRMTEREEAAKVNYQQLKAGDKLFASRSFASEPAGLPHSVRTLTLLQPTSLPALRHNRSAADDEAHV